MFLWGWVILTVNESKSNSSQMKGEDLWWLLFMDPIFKFFLNKRWISWHQFSGKILWDLQQFFWGNKNKKGRIFPGSKSTPSIIAFNLAHFQCVSCIIQSAPPPSKKIYFIGKELYLSAKSSSTEPLIGDTVNWDNSNQIKCRVFGGESKAKETRKKTLRRE